MVIDPTDILALVLLAVFSVRRSDAKATDPRAFPGVAAADFQRWQGLAIRARSVMANACFGKAALNAAWFFGFRNHVSPAVLMAGGRFLFLAWMAALAFGLWMGFRANRVATRLGIVEGRRLVEAPPDAPG